MFPSSQYSGRQDPDAGADPGPESLHQAQPLPQTPGRRHQEHQRGHPAGGGQGMYDVVLVETVGRLDCCRGERTEMFGDTQWRQESGQLLEHQEP